MQEPRNASQSAINDCEMDSILRMLGRVRNDEVSFTDSVMDRLDSVVDLSTGNEDADESNVFGKPSLAQLAENVGETGRVQTQSKHWRSAKFSSAIVVACVVFLAAVGGVVWWNWDEGSIGSPDSLHIRVAETTPDKSPIRHEEFPEQLTIVKSPRDQRVSDPIDEDSVQEEFLVADDEARSDEKERAQPSPMVDPKAQVQVAKDMPVQSNEDPYGVFELEPAGETFVVECQIKFELDKAGMGVFEVDGRPIEPALLPAEAGDVIRRVGRELAAKVRFLTPELGDFFAGSISTVGPDWAGFEGQYEFSEWRGLTFAFGRLQRKVGKIVPGYSTASEINHKKRVAYVDDVSKEMLRLAQAQLRRAAVEMVEHTHRRPASISRLGSLQNFRTVSIKELEYFARNGVLEIPGVGNGMFDIPVIQTASEAELQAALNRSTKEIGVFESNADFLKAYNLLSDHTAFGRTNRRRTQVFRELNLVRKTRSNTSDKNKLHQLMLQTRELHRELKALNGVPQPVSTSAVEPVELLSKILKTRPDLQGLALTMGEDCKSGHENSIAIADVSQRLGTSLSFFNRFSSRKRNKTESERAEEIYQIKKSIHSLLGGENARQRLETMDQMLVTAQPEVRSEMIRALAEWRTESAVSLISCYAKYDLSSEVRAEAVSALSLFPADQVREQLLPGLEYPNPDVARNTAEAIVRLNDISAVPEMVELLSRPDPRMPIKSKSGNYFKRELVAINHLKNCLLCHADSQWAGDPARGVVPLPEQELPVHYYRSPGFAVRADITYLRQDFSVIQPVENPGEWPENQRFDYVIQDRRLDARNAAIESSKYAHLANVYHEIIGKALRLLTNYNPVNDDYHSWKTALKN